MSSSNKILGIYTPVQWHDLGKPSLKDKPYSYCWVCRKGFKRDYQRWYRQRKKILTNEQ